MLYEADIIFYKNGPFLLYFDIISFSIKKCSIFKGGGMSLLRKVDRLLFNLASTEKIVKKYGLIEPNDNIVHNNILYKVKMVSVNKETFVINYVLQNCDEPTEILHANALLYEPEKIRFYKI